MDLREREEKYLNTLRRYVISLARLLLFLAIACLVLAAISFAVTIAQQAGVEMPSETGMLAALGTAGLLSASAWLFGMFLMVMFVFLFIKIELDLRDIRDAVRGHQGEPNTMTTSTSSSTLGLR